MSIDIVYEDEWLVAANKPAGLLSVPGRGAETDPAKADCVRARVLDLFPLATGPMTVHRLDQDTSGLILLALDARTHRAMSILFQHREIEKSYTALVAGHHAHLAPGSAGEIEMPISTDWPNRPRKVFDPEQGKHSHTRYSVRARESFDVARNASEPATRLHLEPVTGRGHQLRVHCAFAVQQGGLGAPIIGDRLYNPDPGASRLLLHATSLAFAHPRTNERLELRSRAPF